MEDLQNYRPNFLNFALPPYQQYGRFHNVVEDYTPDFLGASTPARVRYHNTEDEVEQETTVPDTPTNTISILGIDVPKILFYVAIAGIGFLVIKKLF